MKKILAVCSLGLFLLSPSLLGAMEESPDVSGFQLKGTVAVVSNYIRRGFSQTDDGPALQGGVGLRHETGFLLGMWGSNVDFNDPDDTHFEMNYYAGLAQEWRNGFGMDIGTIFYVYPDAPGALDYDYHEFYLGVGYRLMDARLKVKYSYAEDFFGVGDKSASYIETNVSYALPYKITLHAHAGHSFGPAIESMDTTGAGIHSYDDYNLGIATELLGVDVDLSVYSVNGDARKLSPTTHADDSIALGVSKSF